MRVVKPLWHLMLVLWRGKVLAQVVESTLYVWEDLGSSPMYAFVCYFNLCIIWVIYLNARSDNIILKF